MKRLLVFLIALFFCFNTAKAQLNINDMAMYAEDTPDNVEIILHNHLLNDFNQTVDVTWQKIEAADKPSSWRFAICDKITCHYYTVFSNTFSLNADSSSIIDAHLQPRGMEGQSTLLLKVYSNASADTATVSYTFNVSSTLGLDKPEISTVKLFPTVTNNTVNIVSSKNLERIEVYSLTGKMIKVFNANQPNKTQIDLSNQNNGIYILKTFSTNNKLLSVNKVIKK